MKIPEYTLTDLKASLTSMVAQLSIGCGDGGCIIKVLPGQHTNGGCICRPRTIARRLKHIAEAIERRTDWEPAATDKEQAK